MSLTPRPGQPTDAKLVGRSISKPSEPFRRPTDIPSPELAIGFLELMLTHSGFYTVVAEFDRKTVGSNFMANCSGGAWPAAYASHNR
jgi:hypothetical protein